MVCIPNDGEDPPKDDDAEEGVNTAKDTMDEILRRHGGEDDEEE